MSVSASAAPATEAVPVAAALAASPAEPAAPAFYVNLDLKYVRWGADLRPP